MKLIIAEKPELARAIALAVLGEEKKQNGYIEKGEYCITWAFGHLLTLKEPEDYDKEKYKAWNISQLPIYFENWEHKEDKEEYKKTQLKVIKNLLKQCESIIHAGDPDSEGQYLIDELLTFYKNKKPVKRLLINDNNAEYIRKAFLKMEDNNNFKSLTESAYARNVSDLVFGVNMSRYFTVINGNQGALTVGRVQTPTLGLVVNRDLEILNHIKKKYYTYNLIVENNISFSYLPNENDPVDEKKRIIDKSYLENIDNHLKEVILPVIVQKKKEKIDPPLPFNLAKLQVYCNEKFNYSPKETLDITQSLREKYKAITYNRSDSQYLNTENFFQAEGILENVFYSLEVSPKVDTTIQSKCFDDKKVTAHHAIIPTNTKVDLSKLSEKEKNVYIAICNYYIIQFMKPKKIEKTIAEIDINNYSFRSVSTNILDPSWQSFLKENKKEEDEETQSSLSLLDSGSYSLKYTLGKITEKETEPNKKYTEATLISDMTSIAKYVKDVEIKAILKKKDQDKKGESGSIGTSATRASIIEALYKRKFIEKKGKQVVSTELGRNFYNMLPEYIKTADITAKWWLIQEEIISNNASSDKLILSVLDDVKQVLNTKIQGLEEKIYKCLKCGNNLRRMKGKKGYFWSCSNYPDCKNTFPDNNGKPDLENKKKKIEMTDYKCECGVNLVKREVFKKPGRYWYGCSKYPECTNRYFLEKNVLKKF